MTKLFQKLIKIYTILISPLIGQNCRYHPTCSCYAHEALEEHGALKGLYLTMRRILRCHPWSKHSYKDPVPKHFTWASLIGYKRMSKTDTD